MSHFDGWKSHLHVDGTSKAVSERRVGRAPEARALGGNLHVTYLTSNFQMESQVLHSHLSKSFQMSLSNLHQTFFTY